MNSRPLRRGLYALDVFVIGKRGLFAYFLTLEFIFFSVEVRWVYRKHLDWKINKCVNISSSLDAVSASQRKRQPVFVVTQTGGGEVSER